MSPSTPAPLEAESILSEIPGRTGTLLWKTLRAVRVSAAGSERERAAELSSAGARETREREITSGEVGGELDRPLRRLTALLDPSASMGKEKVVIACGEIATWARESGALATAAAFSEAAALTRPEDADLAMQVVRDARRREDLVNADRWCHRAMLLGRRSSNWDAYTRALLSLGIMAKDRGNLPAARQTTDRALRLAQRRGVGEPRAIALHELFIISLEYGEVQRARGYARRAFEAYGACHPDVHTLSHDQCCFWLSQGQFERGQRALRSVFLAFAERDRLMVAANLAQAAAGLGDRREFRRAWAVALSALEWRQAPRSVGTALLCLARAATGVAEWEMARTMAERARAIAEAKREWKVLFTAESVLGRVRERRSALPAAR